MFIPKLFIAGADFVSAGALDKDLNRFAMNRSLMWSFVGPHLGDDGLGAWLGQHWKAMLDWISQPHVMAVIIAWAVTFTIVCVIILGLGFGPIGVGAGTLAAAFQSWMYGGFTPAGGIFATLTSMAMLGTMMPMAAVVASLLATIVATIAWACGVGTA